MELHLAWSDAHHTQVAVTCNGTFSHTFDPWMLIPNETNGLPHPIADPVEYGKALCRALFSAENPAAQALSARPSRILLIVADDELDAIPWEYAYGSDGYVACFCSFVRGLPQEQRIPPPSILNGLHIVTVVSSPLSYELAPLNIQGEWIRLTEIVTDLDRAVTLERAWPPTIRRLRELVAGQQQRVVHFMGHGGQNEKDEAVLCFERDDGSREDISAQEFVQRVQGGVFLVTLNACESATPGKTVFGNLAKALVRERVPYALGMRFLVHDDDALAFSRDFYSNLARGVPVEDALLQARLTLAKSERAWACGNLVLYTSLAHAAPEYRTEQGEPDAPDAQEDTLLGIISVLPEVKGAFQGRIDEQIQLGKWLIGDRRPRIMTIHGSGGQGKTALARVAVERFAHGWPGGVWAITLETVPTLAVFLANLARFLGINPQESTERADLERQIQLRLRRKRTLLILDNLETLDEAARAQDAEALALIEFIQRLPGERTSLLCTSRHLLGWNGEQSLELSGLTPDEGAALFEQSTPNRASEIDQSLAQELSWRIEGHPLGLFLLGKAFNEAGPTPLSAFLTEHDKYLLTAENRFIDVDHRQRKLFANFEYSVRWLPQELRQTLSQLWVFHAPFFPATAVAVLDPQHDEKDAKPSPIENHLYTLWQRGLLTREGPVMGDEHIFMYRLPPVMRPYVETYLAHEDGREELLKRFGEAYAEMANSIYRGLVRGRAIAGLALECYEDLARGASFVEDIMQGYYLLHWGWILRWLGDRQMGLALTERALEIAEGHDRSLEGQALHNLAMMSSTTGHPYEALRLYEQALLIRREVGDRSGEGTTLNNLGRVYNGLGQKQKALDYYEQALLICREVGDRSGEGTTLNNLGGVYDDLGQKQKALDYYEQALLIRREVGDRSGEGTTLHNIGMIYARAGQLDVTLACLLLAKALYEYVQSPSDIEDEEQMIAALQGRLGEEQFTLLFAQVQKHPYEIVERALREKTLADETEPPSSTQSTEPIEIIINNTVAVMTTMPERRAEWRETIAGMLASAREQGSDRHNEVDFFTVILVILDGQQPSLPADYPYAAPIATIQESISRGGSAAENGGAESEGEQAWVAFIQACVAALRSENRQEKLTFMQQLATLQAQTTDDDLKEFLQAIQLALLGSDLVQIGDGLTGPARQMWEVIIAAMQQQDIPPAPDTPASAEE